MTPRPNPGLVALVVGCALAAQLCLAAVVLRTDQERVYFLNHPIPETCGWRAHHGIPCPACGWTRGVVLALHGQAGAAFRANPAGPLTVAGIAATALVLLLLSAVQRRSGRLPAAFPPAFAAGLLAYSAACLIAAFVAWVRVLSRS
jgi:hypothetical protein